MVVDCKVDCYVAVDVAVDCSFAVDLDRYCMGQPRLAPISSYMSFIVRVSFIFRGGACAETIKLSPPISIQHPHSLYLTLIAFWHSLQVERGCRLYSYTQWVHEANGSLGSCPRSGLQRPRRWSVNFANWN